MQSTITASTLYSGIMQAISTAASLAPSSPKRFCANGTPKNAMFERNMPCINAPHAPLFFINAGTNIISNNVSASVAETQNPARPKSLGISASLSTNATFVNSIHGSITRNTSLSAHVTKLSVSTPVLLSTYPTSDTMNIGRTPFAQK